MTTSLDLFNISVSGLLLLSLTQVSQQYYATYEERRQRGAY